MEQAMDGLILLLGDVEEIVDVVVVEGNRDFKALRNLGFKGKVEVFSKLGLSDAEFASNIASMYSSVLLLTDYDEEGRRISRSLSTLLERGGTKVEKGLRMHVGRFMAAVGVYAIEDLDNVHSNLSKNFLPGPKA